MTALEEQNLSTFTRFNIGAKLILTNVGTKVPTFGILEGFQYNSLNELILVINVFRAVPLVLHPQNCSYRIQIL